SGRPGPGSRGHPYFPDWDCVVPCCDGPGLPPPDCAPSRLPVMLRWLPLAAARAGLLGTAVGLRVDPGAVSAETAIVNCDAQVQYQYGDEELSMLELLNEAREAAGLQALNMSPTL